VNTCRTTKKLRNYSLMEKLSEKYYHVFHSGDAETRGLLEDQKLWEKLFFPPCIAIEF